MMIVKMQRSLTTSAANQQVLIYNEPKTILIEQDLTPEVSKWFDNQDKVYAKASYKKGRLTIHGLVKAQAW